MCVLEVQCVHNYANMVQCCSSCSCVHVHVIMTCMYSDMHMCVEVQCARVYTPMHNECGVYVQRLLCVQHGTMFQLHSYIITMCVRVASCRDSSD